MLEDDSAPEVLPALGQSVRRCSCLSNHQSQPGDVPEDPALQIHLLLGVTVWFELQRCKMRIIAGESPSLRAGQLVSASTSTATCCGAT